MNYRPKSSSERLEDLKIRLMWSEIEKRRRRERETGMCSVSSLFYSKCDTYVSVNSYLKNYINNY